MYVPVGNYELELEEASGPPIAAVTTGNAVELELLDEESGHALLESGSSVVPGQRTYDGASVEVSEGSLEPLEYASIMIVYLGVAATLADAPSYGFDVSEFERAFPDDVARHRQALEEFAPTDNEGQLETIKRVEDMYMLWQLENNRLVAVDALTPRSASLSPETDKAVEDARQILEHLNDQIGEDVGIDPAELLTTSTEARSMGDAWLGDAVSRRNVGARIEEVILRFLEEENIAATGTPTIQEKSRELSTGEEPKF